VPRPLRSSRPLRSVALLVIAGVLVLAAAACSKGDEPVLSVNGWTLSREAFTDQLQQIADNDGYIAARSATGDPFRVLRAGTDEFDPEFVAEFLNERITFQLAAAEVAKRGLTVTDADRQKATDTVIAGLASGSTDLSAGASTPGATTPGGSVPDGTTSGSTPPGTAIGSDGRAVLDAFGSYRDILVDGVANLQVLQADLTNGVTSDDQLQALYEQLKDTSATQACVRHILVQAGSGQSDPTTGELIPPSEDEYEAALTEITGIRGRIEAGEDFAAVAAEVSDDQPTRAAGGDLGCAPQGSYSAGFDDAVWSQEIGVVGQPVRSEFGYHLIVVTERGTLTFEEMRDDLKAAVEAQSAQTLQGWLTEAAKAATVVVDSGAGTWDAATGLVKAVGAVDAPALDLSPEDPNNPSDDLKPTPSSTTSTIAVPLATTTTTSAP
jgi:hypothetical protein